MVISYGSTYFLDAYPVTNAGVDIATTINQVTFNQPIRDNRSTLTVYTSIGTIDDIVANNKIVKVVNANMI